MSIINVRHDLAIAKANIAGLAHDLRIARDEIEQLRSRIGRARSRCFDYEQECAAYRYDDRPSWDSVEEKVAEIRSALEGEDQDG